jgi:uncharacterized membrane protein YgaE (UPF0421/DUF939 family)
LTPSTAANIKQAIKTGIAGVASLYVSELLKLREGYWAAISAVIVMQSNVGAAVSASWMRLAGTAIGATVGGAFAAAWGANALAFGVAVTITVLICSFLGLSEGYRLACATVAIVMLIRSLSSPWLIAVHRFLSVAVGIVVAVLVIAVVWPARAREHLRQGIVEALHGLSTFFQAVIRRWRGESATPIDELMSQVTRILRQNEDLHKQTIYEPGLGAARQELLTLLTDHVNRIFQWVEALELATREGAGDTYPLKFEPELGQVVEGISQAFEHLAESVAAWRSSSNWPDLASLVSALDEKVAAARKARVGAGYELNEVVRFHSFLLSLRNLARELALAHTAEKQLLPSAH